MKKISLPVLFLIFFLTIASALIAMPKTFPIKFKWGPLHVDRIFYRPEFSKKQNLEFKYGLDLAGGAQLIFEADVGKLSQENLPTALASLKDNIERRVNLFGVSEATVQSVTQGTSHRLEVSLPGVENIDQAISLIGQTARLEFFGEASLAPEATASATIYDLFSKETGLNGSHLTKASVTFDSNKGEPQVALEFNSEGTNLFKKATTQFLNKRIAIFLDRSLVTYPTVNTVITDGKAVITGNFTTETAKTLAAQLNAGSLPVPIKLIAQSQVGASLGKDTIKKGIIAGLTGLIIVAVFMIVNYGSLGLVADLGLIIYALITAALYKLIPITLTFPGIVGFLLSIGMAVDSNILIFERLREETRNGRLWGPSLEIAFGKAWHAIKDANICTIITALILFNPFNWSFLNNSGMVRGFAISLLLGIITSLFTGIFVTRNLLRLFFPDHRKYA